MFGLIIKDLYLTAKNFKVYFFIILVFVACSFVKGLDIADGLSGFYLMYAYLLIAMIPLSLYALDEQDRWCAYSMTLPVSRLEYVSGKYIISIICTAFNILILLVTRLASAVSSPLAGAGNTAVPLSMVFSVSLLIPAISLPFAFKFGSAKSRIFSIFFAIAVAVIVENLSSLGINIDISDGLLEALMYILPPALFAASWLLSVRIYEKKEL